MTFSAEEVAILFHNTYERLAPSFGYETRDDTKTFDPTSKNGRLMIAVCGEVAVMLAQHEAVTNEFQSVSTHRVQRGSERLPCYCWATTDHRIGDELYKHASRHAQQVPEETFKQVLASLVAAVSLLRRGGGKAAASDKVFSIMLNDYDKAIAAGRVALTASQPAPYEEVTP